MQLLWLAIVAAVLPFFLGGVGGLVVDRGI